MTENEKERGIARVIYENKDGIEIMFLCMVMESGKKFTFNNEDSAPRRITIQGEDATLFKADEPGKLNRLRICVLAAALCLGLTVGYCASAAEPAPTTVHADYWSPGLFLDGDVLHQSFANEKGEWVTCSSTTAPATSPCGERAS